MTLSYHSNAVTLPNPTQCVHIAVQISAKPHTAMLIYSCSCVLLSAKFATEAKAFLQSIIISPKHLLLVMDSENGFREGSQQDITSFRLIS